MTEERLKEMERVIDELEAAQAKGEVWAGQGEDWRHDSSPCEAAGYWLEVEREGDRLSGHYIARVLKGDDDEPVAIDDLSARPDDDACALEVEAQAVLLRTLQLAAQREQASNSGWGGTRAGAGRPAEGDEPRSHSVSLKLTASELKALENHAKSVSLSRSRAAVELIKRGLADEGAR